MNMRGTNYAIDFIEEDQALDLPISLQRQPIGY